METILGLVILGVLVVPKVLRLIQENSGPRQPTQGELRQATREIGAEISLWTTAWLEASKKSVACFKLAEAAIDQAREDREVSFEPEELRSAAAAAGALTSATQQLAVRIVALFAEDRASGVIPDPDSPQGALQLAAEELNTCAPLLAEQLERLHLHVYAAATLPASELRERMLDRADKALDDACSTFDRSMRLVEKLSESSADMLSA